MEWLPYVHSPEEGTEEADAQPWTIHIPVQPQPTGSELGEALIRESTEKVVDLMPSQRRPKLRQPSADDDSAEPKRDA